MQGSCSAAAAAVVGQEPCLPISGSAGAARKGLAPRASQGECD